MHRLYYVIALGLPLLLGACLSSPSEPEIPAIEETDFASSLNVDLSAMTETSNGLYYRNLEEGSGPEAATGDTVSVRYTGWLPDGLEFNSNLDHDDPFAFILHPSQVIYGFYEGITGMQVEGSRQLIIPPHLGYGLFPPDNSPIPQNAILVFEVELVELMNGEEDEEEEDENGE